MRIRIGERADVMMLIDRLCPTRLSVPAITAAEAILSIYETALQSG